ncbi:nephrin [Trichonephila clavipes]|nr:nephrin [Trichonephila clavipes]
MVGRILLKEPLTVLKKIKFNGDYLPWKDEKRVAMHWGTHLAGPLFWSLSATFPISSILRGVEKTTSFGSTSELVIRIEASDNGATYRCEAMNSALKAPLTATVAPSVLFPPGSVTIKMKPRKPKAGDSTDNLAKEARNSPELPNSLTLTDADAIARRKLVMGLYRAFH